MEVRKLVNVLITAFQPCLQRRGVEGEEIQDSGYKMSNPRRRSNSSSYSAGLRDFKTKFEAIETDPVFEENVHGPELMDDEELHPATRVDTDSSEGSVNEEEKEKKIWYEVRDVAGHQSAHRPVFYAAGQTNGVMSAGSEDSWLSHLSGVAWNVWTGCIIIAYLNSKANYSA